MASSVTPRWHGDNYQSRMFWNEAIGLLREGSGIVEVTFEANGPKAFDDIVVRYDPPTPRSGALRISTDHFQIKWHVETGGRFGYADLIEPKFIGAQTASILQRLRDARTSSGADASFTFVTTYRIADGDPLAELIFGNDRSLLVEKLFDGTTDASRMGKVRKLWREHLDLATDDELKAIVTGLRIIEGHLSLQALREQIEWRAHAVGLQIDSNSSDFRLDELARQMKARGINKLTKASLVQLCADEGLKFVPITRADPPLPVAIRSFQGLSADIVSASPDNTLLLTDQFRQRYLSAPFSWERDIRAAVEGFLRDTARRALRLEMILDAHASIAFLCGAVLDLKSGADVSLVQKGRLGGPPWRAGDGSEVAASRFSVRDERIGEGAAIAVGISATQPVDAHLRAYVAAALPDVGRIISFDWPDGPGQTSVKGGGHAAALSEQIANTLRTATVGISAPIHIFAACPNSLLFFLGQQHQAIAPTTLYEFDFDGHGNRSYSPTFTVGV